MLMGTLLWLTREKLCPAILSCAIAIGAEVWFSKETLLVAVCPIGTVPKATGFGRAKSAPPVDPLALNPQPVSPVRTRIDTRIANSDVHNSPSRRIGHVKAQRESDTSVPPVNPHAGRMPTSSC